MTDLEKLLALEEIKSVRARYCRFVDTKDWAALRDLFTPGATFDFGEHGAGTVEDRDAFVVAASVPLTDCVTVHHCHCPELALTSDTTATGSWAMEDMLRWDEGAASPLRSLHGYGHYIETYEKQAGRWLISSWRLTRLRVDVVEA